MYCKNCAEFLADTDVICPSCGFAAGTGIKYCEHCGTLIPAGAIVCELCGKPIPQQSGAAAFAQQPQQAYRGQQPYMGTPQQPFMGTPQQPFTGAPQQPFTGTPQQPYMSAPQQPGMGYVPNVQPQPYYTQGQMKSKVTAGVLGILLGVFGVHNFYLGYTGKAVAQLLLTLLSCGALSFVSAIWGFVEGIMVLTGAINKDGKGLPLKE